MSVCRTSVALVAAGGVEAEVDERYLRGLVDIFFFFLLCGMRSPVRGYLRELKGGRKFPLAQVAVTIPGAPFRHLGY